MKRLTQFKLSEGSASRYGMVSEDGTVHEIIDFYHPDVAGAVYSANDILLECPLPSSPSKIVAVGLNYPAHIDEMKHEQVPADPVLFLKAPSTLIAPHHPIIASADWGQIDYEGELAVVIGKTCKNASENDALSYVLGYTLANDVTARTLQRRDTQWGRAKNFDTFCPLGPYLLLHEGQDPAEFQLQTEVEGRVVQKASVSQMRFSVPALIAYISNIMTLLPGDIILTGTPNGVGGMADGQRIRIGIPEIGWLENPFQLEPVRRTLGSTV